MRGHIQNALTHNLNSRSTFLEQLRRRRSFLRITDKTKDVSGRMVHMAGFGCRCNFGQSHEPFEIFEYTMQISPKNGDTGQRSLKFQQDFKQIM